MRIRSRTTQVMFKAGDHTAETREATDLASFHEEALRASPSYARAVSQANGIAPLKVKVSNRYDHPASVRFKPRKGRFNLKIHPGGQDKLRTRSAVLPKKTNARLYLVFEMHNAAAQANIQACYQSIQEGDYASDTRPMASVAEQELVRRYGREGALFVRDLEEIEFNNTVRTDHVEDELAAAGGERITARFGFGSFEQYLQHCLGAGHTVMPFRNYLAARRGYSIEQSRDKAWAGEYRSDIRPLAHPATLAIECRLGREAALHAMDIAQIEFDHARRLEQAEAAAAGQAVDAPGATFETYLQDRVDGGHAAADCEEALDAARHCASQACRDKARAGAYRPDARPLASAAARAPTQQHGRAAALFAMDMALREFEHAVKTQLSDADLEARRIGRTADFSRLPEFPAFLRKWIDQGHAARRCDEYRALTAT